jgi:WD40 repeat protein
MPRLLRPPFAPPNSLITAFTVGGVAEPMEHDHSSDYDESGVYNFEYVFDCKRNCDASLLAASLSTMVVKVYDRSTCSYVTELSGHVGAITDIGFFDTDPAILYSSSSDRTVRMWDVRSNREVNRFTVISEAWSTSFGNGSTLCAIGGEGAVFFFDTRNGRKVGEYIESHNDSVTQVRFHPSVSGQLVSGSEDGLICVFDTSVPSEDDAVVAILPAESAVSKLGFFGPGAEGLWCLTGTETMSLWDISSASRLGEFQAIRDHIGAHYSDAALAAAALQAAATTYGVAGVDLGAAPTLLRADYLVGCAYDSFTNELILLAGNHDGTLHLLDVKPDVVTPLSVLVGGHVSCVRGFDWGAESLVTGGEDARLCTWRAPGSLSGAPGDGASASSRSGSSSGAVPRAGKEKLKNSARSSPY